MIHSSGENPFLSFEIFQKLNHLNYFLELQTNPMPVKYATYKKMFFENIWEDTNYGIRCPLELLPYNYQLQINDILSNINTYEQDNFIV